MSEEIRKRRLEKLETLRALGIEPFGRKFAHTISIREIRTGDRQEDERIWAAGRIIAVRGHGKTTFMDLRDSSGKIQVYFKEEHLGAESYCLLKHLDIGDIIGIEGTLFKTRAGELTILVNEFALLSKALRPLPEKWHGLKDTELRFRRRYLDLISGEKTLPTFLTRSRVIKLIRGFLDQRSFLEVETPMMQPIAGGAAARPFITHNQALDLESSPHPPVSGYGFLNGLKRNAHLHGDGYRPQGVREVMNPRDAQFHCSHRRSLVKDIKGRAEAVRGNVIGENVCPL